MKPSRTTLSLFARLLAFVCALGLVIATAQVAFAQASNITVQVDKPGAPIPKTLFGLFFEDINFGADGGLYPERVKNRSFEFPDPLMGWKQTSRGDSKGAVYILDRGSFKDVPNSHYLRVKVETPGSRLWRSERRLSRHRRSRKMPSTLSQSWHVVSMERRRV